MQPNITKFCADSLRAHLDDNYEIKLKSGHAHEIVAAFFGYNSKVDLLANKKYPLTNLNQHEFIFLVPSTSTINKRIKTLEGSPPNLPSNDVLVEIIHSAITNQKTLLAEIQQAFQDRAVFMAKERIQERLETFGLTIGADWIIDAKLKMTEATILVTVEFGYLTSEGNRSRYSTVDVKFPRVAGNICSGKPEIIPTFYSSKFHDPDFNPDFGIESMRHNAHGQ